MQDHEHEMEQDPASRSGGEETPPYGTRGEQTPADWSGSQEPSAYGASSQEPPAYEASSHQPPPYGASSQEPPAYGASSQDRETHEAGRQQPSYGASSPQTDAFWVSNQQPPGYGPGGQQPPPYPGSWQPPGAGNWPPPGPSFGRQWGTPPQPPRHRGRRALAFAAVAILGVGIGAAAAFGIANNNTEPSVSSSAAQAVPTPGSQRAPLQNTGTSKINTPAIDNAVSPSVADITSKLTYSNETAEGTGIVLNSSGLVLTNNHVVSGATQVTAQIDGAGKTYTARVLGTDKSDDVALLQLQGASGLKPAAIGDSSKVAVGDEVVALGNQGGQGGAPTATSGAITAVNRTITAGDEGGVGASETLHGLLQTDAYIAAGDSGGPLINSSGQVIGMDTAAASNASSQSQLIGFAIPINHALSIAREIAAGHSSSTIQTGQRGFLGVGVSDISTGCGSSFGNFGQGGGSGGGSTAPVNSGALVCNVYSGTPAQSAGLSTGDVITAVNGTTVTSAKSLTTAMQNRRPGSQVTLTWVDTSGQSHTNTITLTAGPAA